MSDIARAVLVGRLTRDPELNESGKVLSIGLAVNRRAKVNDEWTDEVSFFDVKVFGNRASALHGILSKGRQVAIDAKIAQERWEKDGAKRSAVRFYADEVVLLGSRDDAAQQPAAADVPFDADEFAVPAGAAAADDDTIPF